MTTDASLSGWGGHALSLRARGTWTELQARQHINVLEMWAVGVVTQGHGGSHEGEKSC